MSDFNTLAEQFLNMAEKSASGIKTAARLNKKMIVKKLEKDRNDYNALRLSVEEKEKALKDLQDALARDRKSMQTCRSDVLKAYDVLKNMDLIDANEVKFVGDDVGYVRNKRIFRLETDAEGNINLVPFRKKKTEESEEEEELDEEMSVDDMLNSLVG